MPGLSLTVPQAQRLWGLEDSTCRTLLEHLVEARFLRRTPHGRFIRCDASSPATEFGEISCRVANAKGRSPDSRPSG
jgi:hypothetical protein